MSLSVFHSVFVETNECSMLIFGVYCLGKQKSLCGKQSRKLVKSSPGFDQMWLVGQIAAPKAWMQTVAWLTAPFPCSCVGLKA